MKIRDLGRAITLAISLAVTSPAAAAVVVDQDAIVSTPPPLGRVTITVGDRTPPPGSTAPPTVNAIVGQSFTAGISGTLFGIDVQGPFWNPAQGTVGAFRFSLYQGAVPGSGALIESFDYPVFTLPQNLNSGGTLFWSLSSAGYIVEAGDQLSFTIESLAPDGLGASVIIGNVGGTQQSPTFFYNDYAGGTAFYSNNGAPLLATPRDIGFRTYVDTSSVPGVPEPVTWAMMLLGFGAIGAAMRRTSRGAAVA